jgi:hypothetical protein
MGTWTNLGDENGKRQMIRPQPYIELPVEGVESGDRYLQTIGQHTIKQFR